MTEKEINSLKEAVQTGRFLPPEEGLIEKLLEQYLSLKADIINIIPHISRSSLMNSTESAWDSYCVLRNLKNE